MARTHDITLGGIQLGAQESVEWKLTMGVKPYQRAFLLYQGECTYTCLTLLEMYH